MVEGKPFPSNNFIFLKFLVVKLLDSSYGVRRLDLH